MAKLKLTGFQGEIPKRISRLLPDMFSQFSENVRLTSGGIEPINSSTIANEFVSPPDPNDATIYKHDGVWYVWDGLAHVAPGPVADDRLYVTGDGVPKLITNGSEYDLKITEPSTELTGVVSGTGTGEVTTRLYVYTFVTDYGEETAPCPISSDIEWQDGQTVTLSGFELGDAAREVTTQRIYRSQTGPSGTQLYFIDERATSVSDYVDTVALESIQDPIPSLNWTNPDDDLEGLTTLPNGIMAAFVGRTLYFCEPYLPHAWPQIYALDTDFPIVGLAAFGNSVAVATEGNPYLVSGSTPESMYMQKLELNAPCVSKRSVVDLGYSAAYASNDGLVSIDASGARLVSESLFSQNDWKELDPSSFACGQNNGWYFMSYSYLDYDAVLQEGTFYIDLTGAQPFLVRTDVITRSFYYEIQTGKLFYYKDENAYEWDSDGGVVSNYVWRSKVFTYPTPVNFGVLLALSSRGLSSQELAQRQAEIDAAIAANEALFATTYLDGELNSFDVNGNALNGDDLQVIPSLGQELSINVYGDGELRASVSDLNAVKRLAGGYRAREIYIEITGNAFVDEITLATSGKELGDI